MLTVDEQTPLASLSNRYLIVVLFIFVWLLYHIVNYFRVQSVNRKNSQRFQEVIRAESSSELDKFNSHEPNRSDTITVSEVSNESTNFSAEPLQHFGCFGMLPSQEAPIRCNLPQSFINVWGDWATQYMQFGKHQFGGAWKNTFLSGETYRFFLSPHIAGSKSWVGVLIPSNNSASQMFPLCFAATLPGVTNPISAVSHLDHWFNAVEKLGHSIIKQAAAQEQVSTMIKRFSAEPGLSGIQISSEIAYGNADSEDNFALRINSNDALRKHTLQSHTIDALLSLSAGQYSIWVSSGSHDKGSNTLICSDCLSNSKLYL